MAGMTRFRFRRSALNNDALAKYQDMSKRSAAVVIDSYSTSFSLASRSFGARIREDIATLYAVVRIADEIVDGVGAQCGLDEAEVAQRLDEFQTNTLRAMETGFSTNPVLQAFAEMARRCGIDPEHLRAFFATMRQDVAPHDYDRSELETYVYGSAEVIGLMCLAIFTADAPPSADVYARCVAGARALGRAFQMINFLRDYAQDSTVLGRHYLQLTPKVKDQVVCEIREDLATAHAAIPDLPIEARTGVIAAYLLFSELTDRVDAASLEDIASARVRVPNARKLVLLGQAARQSWQLPRHARLAKEK